MARFDLPFNIAKRDEDQRLVFGWLSVSKDENGETVVDRHGSIIDPEELEQAAYNYVLKYRGARDMHEKDLGADQCVESMVFTLEKQQAMGIPPGLIPECAWWIGLHIPDDATWDAVKKGDRPMLSIGGEAVREYIED